MALITYVKLGQITNLSDARYAAGMGVDALGFCTDPNAEHYIPSNTFSDITSWINGPCFIAELGQLDKLDESYKVSFVESKSTATILNNVNKNILRIIFSVDSANTIEELITRTYHNTEYTIIEIAPDLLEEYSDTIKQLCAKYKIIISTQFNKHTIINFINNVHPFGIELLGSTEEKPGYKDYDEIGDILEVLDEDFIESP